MVKFDPKLLRERAATYRTRAKSEPDNARMLLQLAGDMEAHAARIEGQQNGPGSSLT